MNNVKKKTATKLDAKDRRIVVLEADVQRLRAVAQEQADRAGDAYNKLAELQKKLEVSEQSLKYSNSSRDEARVKLAQIDAFLDSLPMPPPRKIPSHDGYGEASIDTVSRLMTYIATRSA